MLAEEIMTLDVAIKKNLDEEETETVKRLFGVFESSLKSEHLVKVRFIGEDLNEELTFELAPAAQLEQLQKEIQGKILNPCIENKVIKVRKHNRQLASMVSTTSSNCTFVRCKVSE